MIANSTICALSMADTERTGQPFRKRINIKYNQKTATTQQQQQQIIKNCSRPTEPNLPSPYNDVIEQKGLQQQHQQRKKGECIK